MRENRLHESQNTATCPSINAEQTYFFILAGYFFAELFLKYKPGCTLFNCKFKFI